MEKIEKIKYWTINCQNLDDVEFDDLVLDLERFISLRKGNYVLPQNNSEVWLNKFIDSYAAWNERKFKYNRPLSSCFEIARRLSYHELRDYPAAN